MATLSQLREANNRQSLALLQRGATGKTSRTAPAAPEATTSPLIKTAVQAPASMASVYRNDGQATPVATLQTFAWSCDQGDVAGVAKLLTFETAGRAKVAAYLTQLSESQRAQWH